MKIRIYCGLVIGIIMITSIEGWIAKSRAISVCQGSTTGKKVLGHETHERVLDIVFEREGPNRDYDFVLRFEPSNAPESQIVIKRTGRSTQVVEYTSLSGNIYSKLDGLMAKGTKEDPVEMAKLIEVRKKLIEVPNNEIRQWRIGLADSMAGSLKTLEQRSLEAAKGVGTVTIDGTYYRLWYDQIGSQISFGLLDHEVNDRQVTGELQLVRWMNSIRLNLAKRRM